VELPNSEFLEFLVEAKQHTYAAHDMSVVKKKPLMKGSTQLEWVDGDWLYRDIYFGASKFTGQETVFWKMKPVWAMCYSGGMTVGSVPDEAGELYTFLKKALEQVSLDHPVRGPEKLTVGAFEYLLTMRGEIDRFEGNEEIKFRGVQRYSLFFAGGLVL